MTARGQRRSGARQCGGYVFVFQGQRMDWTYKTTSGLVSGVTYVAPPGLRLAEYSKLFVACATKGI